jgi:hypothetical protein
VGLWAGSADGYHQPCLQRASVCAVGNRIVPYTQGFFAYRCEPATAAGALATTLGVASGPLRAPAARQRRGQVTGLRLGEESVPLQNYRMSSHAIELAHDVSSTRSRPVVYISAAAIDTPRASGGRPDIGSMTYSHLCLSTVTLTRISCSHAIG